MFRSRFFATAPVLLLAPCFAIVAPACETFDAPPDASIEGAVQGLLSDVNAPLTIRFTKAIRPDTLTFQIVPLDLDSEGNLPDERPGDAYQTLKPLYSHDPTRAKDFGGEGALIEGDTAYQLTPAGKFPVAQKLAVVIEAGLQNLAGIDTRVRYRVTFAYDFKCSGKGTKLLTSGPYMFLLGVETPIQAEVQLFADLKVDPESGAVIGQFTNADRITDVSRCKTVQCAGALPVCATLPTEQCVLPSAKMENPDYFPDFYPNGSPPVGYGVTVRGCASDVDENTVAFATFPSNLAVTSPAVTIQGLIVVAPFTKGADGILRGTGNGSAGNAVLGTGSIGPATGTIKARSIPPELAPKDIPPAP